jgi:hypothetical protein
VPPFVGTGGAYGGYYTLNSTSGTYQMDTDLVRGVSAFLLDEDAAEQWLMANILPGSSVQVSCRQRSTLRDMLMLACVLWSASTANLRSIALIPCLRGSLFVLLSAFIMRTLSIAREMGIFNSGKNLSGKRSSVADTCCMLQDAGCRLLARPDQQSCGPRSVSGLQH